MIFLDFSTGYRTLVAQTLQTPEFECSPRGQKVLENLHVGFRLTNPRNRLPYSEARDFSITYMVAECLWYFMGNNETEWIENYSAFWSKISDDGKTANSAYGARIFKPNPVVGQGRFTQWEYVKEELKRDPDSRRAVILIRVPDDSIDAKLDVPCTLSLQFFIRDGRLHLAVTMRSSDVILGMANDVPAFTLFQELMALELGLRVGNYFHTSNSLHLYERHFKMAEAISAEGNQEGPEMPKMPSPPPVEALNRIQELARSVTTVAGLRHLVSLYDDDKLVAHSRAPEPYWKDWGYLLMAHRAGKLGDEAYKLELIQKTEFEGYHRFKR